MDNATMNPSQKHGWSSSDYAYTLIPLIPLVIVAAMATLSAASWLIHANRIDAVLAEANVGASATRTLMENYDANASKEHANELQRITSAASAISSRLYVDSKWLNQPISGPDDPWPWKADYEKFAADAAELLRLIHSLPDFDQSVWEPCDLTERTGFGPSHWELYHLREVLVSEFLAAMHRGDRTTAMSSIGRMDSLIDADSDFSVWSEQHRMREHQAVRNLIRRSLNAGVWTAEDLQQLQTLVRPALESDQQWHTIVNNQMLLSLPFLLHQQGRRRSLLRDVVAPSAKIEVIERSLAISRVSSVTTVQSVDRIGELQYGTTDQPRPIFAFDRWLQAPMLNPKWIRSLSRTGYDILAANLAVDKELANWTRTGIAIKQYHLVFDRFPAMLDDLTDVGLPSSATKNRHGDSFGYNPPQQSGEGAKVNVTSLEFDPQKGWLEIR